MSETIKFTVYGEPVAQGRARHTVRNGRAITYDPEKSRTYKQIVRTEALKHRPDKLLEGAISLTTKIYRSIPKSFSKKRHELAAKGVIRPLTKPDLKNVIAGIEDSLKGIIWHDDSQVVDFGDSGKWYSDVPRVEIEIRQV